MAMAAQSPPISVFCAVGAYPKSSKTKRNKQNQGRASGNFTHFFQVVRKDVEFLKFNISKGLDFANEALHVPQLSNEISKGLDFANEALHIPQLSKSVEDIIWLRNLENPLAAPLRLPSWPQPCYPELSGTDLLVADLKALETYASYFYYRSKIWTRPLPEVYDPQEVEDYFRCRPHIVALRLLEVFTSFASAAIRIRSRGIGKLNSTDMDEAAARSVSQYEFGMVLKETMLNLGPTFIKVGQSLSTRPDIIGTEITKALSGLHEQAPPFPRTMAMNIIEEELGSPIQTIFKYLSDEPVAAASFGQVYRGVTHEGLNVAVKVQRPNLRHVVIRDIYILRVGLRILQKIAKRKNDLRHYADELGKGLVGELDYTLEAANASEFMEAHSSYPFIHVPKVLPHLTRKRVLTMEWMTGDNPNNLITISEMDPVENGSKYSERQRSDAKRKLLDLVSKGVEASLVQLLETGLLHADPHPGNLRYISSGQIGFLDFGLLCRMEKKHRFAMLASIVHIVNGDWAALVIALTEMDIINPGTSLRRVTMDLEDALGELEFKDGIPDVRFSKVLGKIWSVALKFNFRMPSYYTLVLRSLASLEGLAMAGDPNYKTFNATYPYVVQKLLTENSPDLRKILHSVMLNRQKEFQWQKLALFLRVGTTRKGLQQLLASKSETSMNDDSMYRGTSSDSSVYDITNLVLRLLLSKNGVVLRRLLMTVNGASLIRAAVSKEAAIFRQQICRLMADAFYQIMSESLEKNFPVTQNTLRMRSYKPIIDYESVSRDRRLKVILMKIMASARKDPVLMARFCFTSLLMFLTASALAFHRLLVSLSEDYLGPLPFTSKQFAV